MAESPPVLCQTKVQWHAFDPPHWQIAWNTFLVFFAVSAWQLLNLRWGATVHCFFVCVLLFFLVLEVTSGLPPSMSVSVGRRNYASLTLFLTLCLSISLLFNGCLSALMHVCHMRPNRVTAASFHSGLIKLQTPAKEDNKGNANLYKGYFFLGFITMTLVHTINNSLFVNKMAR